MTTLTTTYLNEKLNEQTEAILGVIKQGFDEQASRLDRLESALESLVVSVDRFVKSMTGQEQELIVLRKQLSDMERRLDNLELKTKSS